MRSMTIGKLAKSAGVGTGTIRYYEESGFLPKPDRLPSGYRVYGGDAAKRVRFIKEAQALGFTLNETRELFSLTDNPDADCADVNIRARAKLAEIETKIEKLQRMKRHLGTLSGDCPADGQPLSACSIINHLNSSRNSRSEIAS